MARLKSLIVKDFRSIDGDVSVSLDAPIVLIHGPNGAGKTSLLTAIELALTGGVPSLARAEPDYLSFLKHKDRPFGQVRLEIGDGDQVEGSTDIKVTATGIIGSPILDAAASTFFSERSYLAQSTLGRLLEIYQHAEKKSDSPLTQFVKELLGLDRMEALIGGLASAGHISRLKNPVPAYGICRENIVATESTIADLNRQERESAEGIGTLERQLRRQLAAVDPALVDSTANLHDLASLLATNPEEQLLLELVRTRREVEVSSSTWTQFGGQGSVADRNTLEADNRVAAANYEAWAGSSGNHIEALLTRAGELLTDVPDATVSGYTERARLLTARLKSDLQRMQAALASDEAARQRIDNLNRQLDEARTRLHRLDEQLTTSADANEALARTLADLKPHIHDETCPVCDRDFSEVSSVPLNVYVTDKVNAMVEQAGQLQSLAKDRSVTSSSIAQLERDVAATVAERIGDEELNRLKLRGADVEEIVLQLTTEEGSMQEGDRLRDASAQAARRLVALQNSDQSMVVLRSGLIDQARRLGLPPSEEVPTSELLQTVKSYVETREQALNERQAARRLALETVRQLIAAQAERMKLQEKQRQTASDLEHMRSQKQQADIVIELAKDLVRQTRDARARVVRRVFNDELNAVWRDLFVRLAPEEPFIPAFAIPDEPGAEVEAVLETHHRRGGKGGNPRAMLSAGNLNTAALTLFLALNLSSEAKLPWLVIDDPVQSMDEVHIAQFAALLRTLSKQMKRQVIVAVHERSLFDYLTLELSPSFEGDRLNIIELGRNAAGKTTYRWEPRIFERDRAIAA
jgi:exonuclease SbcC